MGAKSCTKHTSDASGWTFTSSVEHHHVQLGGRGEGGLLPSGTFWQQWCQPPSVSGQPAQHLGHAHQYLAQPPNPFPAGSHSLSETLPDAPPHTLDCLAWICHLPSLGAAAFYCHSTSSVSSLPTLPCCSPSPNCSILSFLYVAFLLNNAFTMLLYGSG